ncbi:MAG: phosphonate dehydrogenase [Pseudomonadota bacterium]
MKPKTVITQWVHPEVIEFLSEFTQVVPNQTKDVLPYGRIIEMTQDAQAIMVFMPDTIDDAFLQRCPGLKIVSAALKGYDNFDVAACSWNGVWFTMVPDLLTVPTAELAVGLLINLSRNIHSGDHIVRTGQFNGWRPVLYGKGLDQSTVGIIGMGQVGNAIAGCLSGFGTKIIFTDPDPQLSEIDPAPEPVDLETLLAQSDFIIVATPYLPSTRHLINAKQLGLVRKDAYLINIGRGSCVDEAAVANALANNQLAGYAADVFEFEDWARPDRPKWIHDALIASEKTIFTPHLGSAVDRIRHDIAMQAAYNIKDVLTGRKPKNAVNDPTRWFPEQQNTELSSYAYL